MKVTEPGRTLAARWFYALAGATRLRIIEQITDGERCVCEPKEAMRAPQSRLSFHLKVLRDAGPNAHGDAVDGRFMAGLGRATKPAAAELPSGAGG